MKSTPKSRGPSVPRVLNLQVLIEAASKRQLFAPAHTPETPAGSVKPAVQRFQLRRVPSSALND